MKNHIVNDKRLISSPMTMCSSNQSVALQTMCRIIGLCAGDPAPYENDAFQSPRGCVSKQQN